MAHKENNQNTSQNLVKPILELFAGGKLQDAIDASKKLRKIHPNDPLLLNIIGACHAEMSLIKRLAHTKRLLKLIQTMLRHTIILLQFFIRLGF